MLVGEGRERVEVEEVYDTGEYGTVYNLRVAEYHTYFVGCLEWGFSVWAHNADCTLADLNRELDLAGLPMRRGSGAKLTKPILADGDEDAVLAHLIAVYGSEHAGVLGGIANRLATGTFARPAPAAAPKYLPRDFTPPEGAPIGRRYLVNGRAPIEIELGNPASLSQLPEGVGGLYIPRHRGGQIHKVGEARNLLKRMGDYERDWLPYLPEHGKPVIVDVYPIPGLTRSLEHGEKVLRGRLTVQRCGQPLELLNRAKGAELVRTSATKQPTLDVRFSVADARLLLDVPIVAHISLCQSSSSYETDGA